MNSKRHLFINLAKSAIRVVGGLVALTNGSVKVGGVLEELVDKR